MKITHKEDLKTLGYYQDFNKVLDTLPIYLRNLLVLYHLFPIHSTVKKLGIYRKCFLIYFTAMKNFTNYQMFFNHYCVI